MLAVTSLCLATLLGCSSGSDHVDVHQLAYAKCGVPVREEIGEPSGHHVRRSAAEVQHLGDGRYRVAGVATLTIDGEPGQADYDYTCEVAPDADDLRGFRVTRLDVGEGRWIGRPDRTTENQHVAP